MPLPSQRLITAGEKLATFTDRQGHLFEADTLKGCVMNNRKFGKVTAKALFTMTSWPYAKEPDGAWLIREDGVHINEEFRAVSPIDTAFDWTPTYDMDWPGSPDPMEAPLLPTPFTANELAACMLDGIGRDIQENLDRRIGYVLDADALARFSLGEREVRDALSDAYALAAKAQLQVGEFGYDEHHAAYMLRAQLDDANAEANEREGVFEDGITNQEATQRRERAIASVADLNAHAQQASAAAKAKWFAWRKAMVRQLLAPDAQAEAVPPRILKKSAMLTTYAAEWPTIEADIREAARNGLDAAKTDKKGMWYADKAIEWARSRGKLIEPVQGHSIAAAWRGDSKKHTIGK